ncbi:MAG TPA: glycogen/starch/alpha-glucan phosphorylase, partial [Chlamydiales bacterium]
MMGKEDLRERSAALAQRIKHCLIISTGKSPEKATNEEFYHAFCVALREEIIANWTATSETMHASRQRVAYFFSMEYLPGRLTAHNVLNMGALEWVRATLASLGRNWNEVLRAEPDPGLGNGGLGRLASCFFDSLATLHYPVSGYGLRYQYGIFEQEIWAGQQVERPDCWLLNENPWEHRRDSVARSVNFGGKLIRGVNAFGEEIFSLEDPEEVRAMAFDVPVIGFANHAPYSVLTLRLWSTKESPRNFQLQRFNAGLLDQAAENTSLTDVLYPNDNNDMGKRIRLKQEFLLVSASLQDILEKHLQLYGDLHQLADKVRIQLNDSHPVLTIAELIRTLMKNHAFSWEKARDACVEICSYTNHTILREALVEWNEGRLRELLPRQHNIIERLNLEFCNGVRKRFPGDEAKVRRLSIIENGQIKMAHLAIVGSHQVNGVAALHSAILKEQLFKEFDELYPGKFTNVTNGVTHRRWLL